MRQAVRLMHPYRVHPGATNRVHLFRPRKKKGVGVGEKAGALVPDGIEQMLIKLGRDEPSGALLSKDGQAFERMGYFIAAVADFSVAKAPTKDQGPKKASDWVKWSKEMHEEGVAFAQAAKTKSPAAVTKAAAKVNTTCNNCHSVFRE